MNEILVLTPERILEVTEDVLRRYGLAKATVVDVARALFTAKQNRFNEDPEMFATYLTLAQEACKVVKGHKEGLADQIASIIADGVKQGAFEVADVKASARAVYDASIRFHHPAHSNEWNDPELSTRIDALLALLLRGLEAPRKG